MNRTESISTTGIPSGGERLDSFSDIFLRIDCQGTIIEYVAATLNDFYSPGTASVYGKKIDDLFPAKDLTSIYENLYETVNTNSVTNLDISITSENAERIYKARFIPSVNEQVVVILKEVTRSRKVRHDLLNSKRKLDTIWKHSLDGIRVLDKTGRIISVNDAYCKLVEMEESELINKVFRAAYADETYSKVDVLEKFERQFRNKSIRTAYETKILLRNGKRKFVEVINTFIDSNDPQSEEDEVLLLSIFRDLTGQKESQEAGNLLAEIVDSSHDAIISNSLNGIITSWNTGAEKMFGYLKNEVKGLSLTFLIAPEHYDEINDILDKARQGEKLDNYETVFLTKDGNQVYISATVSPIRDSLSEIKGVSLIVRNITEKKKIENTLRESEERYRSLIETSPDAVVLLDFEGKVMMCNRHVAEIWGFSSVEEVLGRSIFDNLLESDKFGVLRHAKNIMDTGRLKRGEFTLINRNNTPVPVEVSASLIFNNLGMPDAIISVIRDISERKKAELALSDSEMQFRSIWENSNDGMRLTDENGNIVAVNKAFCKLVEAEESKLLGKPFNSIYISKGPRYLEESLNVYKKNFKEKTFTTHKQSKSTFICGKSVDLDVTYSLIGFENGRNLLLAIFHDITERKKVEEELRNNEKHAAIGKMAAYLSHEIKTPLASIKMNIDMLSRGLEILKEKQKSFNIIQKEIKRLNNLLKSVLQFSRQVDLVPVKINLLTLINNIKDFVEPTLKEKQIIFLNNVNNLVIKGDYQKLHTVLLHMIENSIEAIGSIGVIEISSSESESCNTIYIKDSGSGITLPSQIFDPFFTTKASGTGLGLSIAQKIIEQHNGKIELISSKRGETTFSITLLNN